MNDFFNKLKYRTAEVDACLKSIEADKYLKFTGSYPVPTKKALKTLEQEYESMYNKIQKEKKKNKKRKKIFGIRLPF